MRKKRRKNVHHWEGQRSWWTWRAGIRAAMRGRDVFYWLVDQRGRPYAADSYAMATMSYAEGQAVFFKECQQMLERGRTPKPQSVAAGAIDDRQCKASYPTLHDYLYQTTWDDGKPRMTSSVTLFMQDNVLKAVIKDRDGGICLWVSARSLVGLLEAIDAALADPQSDWREERDYGKKSAKRVQPSTRQGG